MVHGLGITKVTKVLLHRKVIYMTRVDIFETVRHLRVHLFLTLFVAEKTLFPSLSSGTNFCSRAFCTFQMAGGSLPAIIVTWTQAAQSTLSLKTQFSV